MLVQELDDRLRLIRQQDHARLAGALAHAWRVPPVGGPGASPGQGDAGHGEPLPYRVVWATGVHDAAWTGLDRRPILDPESGRPFDFHRLPLERKLGPYRDGIDRISDLDPYAGFQVSRHYCSFLEGGESGGGRPGDGGMEAFLEDERERRARLRERLPDRLRGDALLDRELAYLKLFDTLSLYVCLAGPGAGPATRPGWLVPGDHVETPERRRVELRWRSDDELILDPGPLARAVDLRVPCREVPRVHGSQEQLEESWREASTEHLSLRVSPVG